MKKVTQEFFCDECGASLPKEHVLVRNNGECYFDSSYLNRASWGNMMGEYDETQLSLTVQKSRGAYAPITTRYTEFCPKCRLMWLKKAVDALEKEVAKEDENISSV